MEKTGIAVVGCGAIAQGVHLPNIAKHPGLELLWCCDIDDNTLLQARSKFNPAKITNDVREVAGDENCKIIMICTADNGRYNLIKTLAESGKNIYTEKPLADSFEEMFAIAEIVKKTGIKFCVGHNRRMSPAIKEARKIHLKHKNNPVSPTWRWKRLGDKKPELEQEKQTFMLLRINDDCWSWKAWTFVEGSMISEMTHFADIACYFIEKSPVRVTTVGNKKANQSIVIEFSDGSLATIVATVNGTFGYPKELIEIYQGGAAIIIDHLLEIRTAGIEGETFRKVLPLSDGRILRGGINEYYDEILAVGKKAVESGDNSRLPTFPDKGHYGLLDAFLQEVLGGEPTPNGLDESMKSTAVILKAIESCETKKSIEISPSDYTV